MENRTIRWGIIGAGYIAKKFSDAMPFSGNSKLVAVASKTSGKASAFIAESPYPNAVAYDNYEDLLKQEEVDVVYVATINTRHFEDTLLVLDHGKAALVEKPFALNEIQSRVMIEKAREKGLFLMEAMWSRFNPVNRQVRSLISSGRIGAVEKIEASFGYFGGEDKSSRHLNRDLGGGSLLDVGVYPISYSSFMLGRVPEYKEAAAVLDPVTGVDRQFVGVGSNQSDCLVVSSASVVNQLGNSARIYGTSAVIHVPVFFNPKEAYVMAYGEDQEAPYVPIETLRHNEEGNGYQFEIREVADLLLQGKTESVIMPLAETLNIVREMDGMRRHWGLRYPGEA